MEYSDSPKKSGLNRPTLLIVVMGFGLYLWMTRFKNEPPHAATPVEIEQLRTLGNAHLENLDFGQADALIEKLAEIVPSERLPFQNLSVTRLLAAQPENRQANQTPDDQQRLVERAELAVLTLVDRFPGHEDTRVLASRFAKLVNDSERAIQELELAVKAAPHNAAIHYEFYSLTKDSDDPEVVAKGASSLKQAVELAPRNLFLVTELALQQAKASKAELGQTLTTAQSLLAPFVDKVKKSVRLDLNEHLEKTQQLLAQAGQDPNAWTAIRGNVSIMVNVLRPEVARQLDEKRVSRHLLEFVVDDFSPAFYLANGRPTIAPSESIPVRLVRQSLPEAKDIRHVRLLDFNLDGHVDVCATSGKSLQVWTSKDKQWNPLAQFDLPEGTRGAVYFDLDRDRNVLVGFKTPEGSECADAALDVVTFGERGLQVWRNELRDGKRALKLVKQSDEMTALKEVLAVLPVDFDHDGDLDLVVSTSSGLTVWSNRDDSTFSDVTPHSTLPNKDFVVTQMLAVDWNRNVSIDVVCLGANGAGLLENVLHGQFVWKEFPPTETAFKQASSMALMDADANFSWDLVVGGAKSVDYVRTRNPDGGVTQLVGHRAVVPQANAKLAVWDYDNDGWQDLLVAADTKLTTLRGGPVAAFHPQGSLSVDLPSPVVSIDTEDVDGDQDLDVIVATSKDGLVLLENEGGSANRALRLPIRGEDAKEAQRPNERVNLVGFGSLVELRTKASYVPQVVTRQWTHFGLGQQESAEAVRVLWTNGVPENFIHAKSGQSICMQQKLKGSCPYLYTWDGKQMSFFTDCLWAAPVGLQFAEGVIAPTRDWEYLKIDGDRLKAKRDEYHLSLTEELWEIAYIDSMRLIAIDHPADVEIYSNEKVGPPDLAEFKIHTVRKPRTPIAAKDQRDRDVLPQISQRDDQFVRAFDRRVKQGLTEPHHVELDLGSLQGAKSIKLFLTGWMKPTDTSLNIAISQRPDLEGTQPPSVWVPDANGTWQRAQAFMGFPGGKTKTIVVDLSSAFLTNDYRVRIATTMELYWDQIFFTVDDEPADVRQTEQPLVAGNLNYRGFSQQSPHPQFGPERYDYSQLNLFTSWPPLDGRLTGYGDVTAMLRAQDAQQVVLGAGDELQLRFKAAADVPAGWKRDFILHNVGWDKDADLNTVYGQTVEPLPYVGMQGYPELGGQAPKVIPQAHQTRTQSRVWFWRHMFVPEL